MQLSLEKAFLGTSVLSWIPFLGCLRACVQASPPVQASFEVESAYSFKFPLRMIWSRHRASVAYA
jgi:hypothetical protein